MDIQHTKIKLKTGELQTYLDNDNHRSEDYSIVKTRTNTKTVTRNPKV